MKTDVMAFGAHPDDLELSCGGTIAGLVARGHRVVLVDLTKGELGTRGSPAQRQKEAAESARILGVAERRNLGIPDANIGLTRKNLRTVISVIREFQPRLLLIPHGVERHPDHAHAHALCKEAWYYSGLAKLTSSRSHTKQDPHRPHAYFEFIQWYEIPPSFVVDISLTFEKKMEAIRAYGSQFYNPESRERPTRLSRPDFLESVELRCRYYGMTIGVRYGEPFYFVGQVGVSNLFDIVSAGG